MSFLVRDMIELRLFSGARIVAGHRGSGNVMRWVNIMEILDMPGSVQEHELLVTTAYRMEDEQKHKNLLTHLKARGACGIAIQPGYYISSIPTYILKEADRLDFPVIELPHDLTFSHITHVLLECIVNSEQDELAIDRSVLLQKLSQWEKSTPSGDRSTLQESVRCLLWLTPIKPSGTESTKLKNLMNQVKQFLQQKSSRVFTHMQGGGTLLYAQGLKAEQASTVIEEVNLILCDAGQMENINLQGGAAILLPGQSNEKGLEEALEAAEVIKSAGAKRGVCPHHNIGLFKLLTPLGGGSSVKTQLTQLNKLLAYDKEHNTAYVKTMRAYLTSEGNACACAEKLYIHRHTLKNRLEKIDELCGISMNDYYVRLQLSMELLLHDLF